MINVKALMAERIFNGLNGKLAITKKLSKEIASDVIVTLENKVVEETEKTLVVGPVRVYFKEKAESVAKIPTKAGKTKTVTVPRHYVAKAKISKEMKERLNK